MRYWEVEKWDGNTIIVPEKIAKFIADECAKGNDHITWADNFIARKDIREIRKTSKRPDVQQYDALKSGKVEDQVSDGGPLLNPDGSVLSNWYKKGVTQREWNSYYSKHPGYYRLSTEGGTVVMGFRRVEHKNSYIPDDIYQCTDDEVRRLEHV